MLVRPLEERRKQLETELPRLQAEVDILKVNNLSAEEIAAQASNLYDRWQTMPPHEQRELVEVITDKIIIGKDEITINLCYAPSCKDMAIRWRKGLFLNPFCQLVVKVIRVDSPPCNGEHKLAELLTECQSRLIVSREALASKLGVSLGTLKNWERGWTQPNRRFWPSIRTLFSV